MKGFILDLNRCTGCHACRLACSIENDLGAGESWREIYTFNLHRSPKAPRFHLSLGCQHCEKPACLQGCPAGAYSRDPTTGAVLVDHDHCMGCNYCRWACPYDAPHSIGAAGTISKCTLCNQRLLKGKNPACAALCPTGALQYGEFHPGHGVADIPGFPSVNIGPAIRFMPLRTAERPPELSAGSARDEPSARFQALDSAADPTVTLRSEWPLVLFTLGAALLTAMAAAAFDGTMRISPDSFFLAALIAIGVSALHLGAGHRSWRAVVNLRTSWLSREIAGYLAFMLLTTAMLSLPAYSDLLGWPAVLAGFAALYSIDRVYEAVSPGTVSRLHSARSLLTGLFFFGILTANPIVSGVTGLGKLVLYAHRQPWNRSRARFLASLLRLGAGFVLPLAIWHMNSGWVLPAVLLGECIDRCEYYLDLNLRTPQKQISADLRKAASIAHAILPTSHQSQIG